MAKPTDRDYQLICMMASNLRPANVEQVPHVVNVSVAIMDEVSRLAAADAATDAAEESHQQQQQQLPPIIPVVPVVEKIEPAPASSCPRCASTEQPFTTTDPEEFAAHMQAHSATVETKVEELEPKTAPASLAGFLD